MLAHKKGGSEVERTGDVARRLSAQILVCVCWPETPSWALRLLWTRGTKTPWWGQNRPPLTFPRGPGWCPCSLGLESTRTKGQINTGLLAKTDLIWQLCKEGKKRVFYFWILNRYSEREKLHWIFPNCLIPLKLSCNIFQFIPFLQVHTEWDSGGVVDATLSIKLCKSRAYNLIVKLQYEWIKKWVFLCTCMLVRTHTDHSHILGTVRGDRSLPQWHSYIRSVPPPVNTSLPLQYARLLLLALTSQLRWAFLAPPPKKTRRACPRWKWWLNNVVPALCLSALVCARLWC